MASSTNYDNLLEISIDPNIKKELNDQIQELSDFIRTKEDEKFAKETELVETEQKLSLATAAKKPIASTSIGLAVSTNPSITDDEIYNLQKKIWPLRGNIDVLSNQIKIKNQKLTELGNVINDCLTLIRHSSDLAIKKNKNIIKIHGSLRDADKDHYGFDNDPRIHYVISQEDFDTYPAKHEAFTQLMRISLLQESFCLIGFSGMDPNFLAWIGWVRDIIQRKKTPDNENNDDKIYLIDVSKDNAPNDKALFYRNHRIAHIPIMQDCCINWKKEKIFSFSFRPSSAPQQSNSPPPRAFNPSMKTLSGCPPPDCPAVTRRQSNKRAYAHKLLHKPFYND